MSRGRSRFSVSLFRDFSVWIVILNEMRQLEEIRGLAPLSRDDYPRTIYISDVPVEDTVSGMAVMYRLFERWPADKLLISARNSRCPEKRLVGVTYHESSPRSLQLFHSRLRKLLSLYLAFAAEGQAAAQVTLARYFEAECVVTVTHEFAWLTAARVAGSLHIPLVLVNHDECITNMYLPSFLNGLIRKKFCSVYLQASARLCVSPGLERHYYENCGVHGEVLYPSRRTEVRGAGGREELKHGRPFTVAYAGTLHLGYPRLLRRLAGFLETIDARLLITNLSLEHAGRLRLTGENIVLPGLVDSSHFVEYLREEADLLLVLMSGKVGIRSRTSFPSKIADYSLTGRPLILYAPDDSTVMQWAQEYPGTAVAIREGDWGRLCEEIRTLGSRPDIRKALGAQFQTLGEKLFGSETTSTRFLAKIKQAIREHRR